MAVSGWGLLKIIKTGLFIIISFLLDIPAMGTHGGAAPRGASQTAFCARSRSRTLPALPTLETSAWETLPCSLSLDSL